MNMGFKLSISLIVSGILVAVLVFLLCQTVREEFRQLEEPISMLVTPIKEINTGVFLEQGDLISGGRAVVVRLVDANDREVCLVAVRRPNANSYSSVIVDPPIQWEWDNRIEMADNFSIPADLYDPPKTYKTIENVEFVVKDLIYIIEKYRDPKDREIDIALEALRK